MLLHSSQVPSKPADPKDPEPVVPPAPKPEHDSDVHPQRHPGEPPLPDESDNIPGNGKDLDLA